MTLGTNWAQKFRHEAARSGPKCSSAPPIAPPSTKPFSFLFPTLERLPYTADALAFLRGKLQGTFSSNIPRHIKTFRRRPTLPCSPTDLAFAFTRYSRSLRRLNPPSIVALSVGHSRGARSVCKENTANSHARRQ